MLGVFRKQKALHRTITNCTVGFRGRVIGFVVIGDWHLGGGRSHCIRLATTGYYVCQGLSLLCSTSMGGTGPGWCGCLGTAEGFAKLE
jgi:hypothetical protein